jgi:hypothetical protein
MRDDGKQLTKQSSVEDELMIPSPIELEDGHVGCCADDKQHQKD